MEFLVIKWIHITSATLLFGTGLGSAFYKFMADRSNDVQAIASTNKNVVLADWIFTTPTVIIQPVSGFIMLLISGYSVTTPWLVLSVVLYLIAGICWLPVVILQIKMRDISSVSALNNLPLPEIYWKQARIWFWLGVPAFICMIVILFLMITRPTIL